MQFLTTWILSRLHGMMECWNHGIMLKNAKLQRLHQGFWIKFYSFLFCRFFNPWFVYPANRIIFQTDGKRIHVIFQYPILP